MEEVLASQRQFEQESELESEEEAAADGKAGKGRAVAQALRRCSPLMVSGRASNPLQTGQICA